MFLTNLWNVLNGNKTIIFGLLFGFVSEFGLQIGMSDLLVNILMWVFGFLGTGSLIQHVSKGSFTTHYK